MLADRSGNGTSIRSTLRDDGVAVFVRRRATTQQAQGLAAGVPQLVFLAGRNRHRIAGFHFAKLAFDPHPPGARRDEINFFRSRMVVRLGAAANGQARLRQALVADNRVAVGEQFANFRAVFRDEGRRFVEVFDVHKSSSQTLAERSPAGE